jgi:hypothetical protein
MTNETALQAGAASQPKHPKDMTADEIRERIITLGFDGDAARFEQFREKLRAGLPDETSVALRGSAVTAQRWEDGAPFDADGPGTSDLDVTLIGKAAIGCWQMDAYYIPGLHTMPLSDKDPDIAPALNGLRLELQKIARRPVNFQATADIVLFARDVLFDQPYFMLIEAPPP